MTEKVYVVQQGCYSDRHIVRIFATSNEADTFVEGQDRDLDVSEWGLGEAGYFTGTKYVSSWKGDTETETGWSRDVDESHSDMEIFVWEHRIVQARYPFSVSVEGYDKDRVLRALHDRVAQLKAEHAEIA